MRKYEETNREIQHQEIKKSSVSSERWKMEEADNYTGWKCSLPDNCGSEFDSLGRKKPKGCGLPR